jgi:hypothetical protein
MSEQKLSFTQELDLWSDESVITPISAAQKRYILAPMTEESLNALVASYDEVKRAIRKKMLQSYRNGRMTRISVPENLPVQMPRVKQA